jgi:phi LC3 family holin
MKINWKVRLKNPAFWITVVPAIITVVYAILSVFNVIPAVAEETIVKGFMALMSVLATLGIVVDPTTKGIKDSDRAMTYDKPCEGVEEDADI